MKYTIKELYEAYKNDERPTPYTNTSFLGGAAWCFEAVTPEDIDTRPDWVKTAAANAYEPAFVRTYGDWCYERAFDDVYAALDAFQNDNYVYELLHRTSLEMVYKAFTAEFNPIENYDRTEDTDVVSNSTSGATNKVATDDTEDFYNTANATGSMDGTTTTTSRIHGNIGVTRSDQMTAAIVEQYSDARFSMMYVFYDRLVQNCCYLVDYGNDIV